MVFRHDTVSQPLGETTGGELDESDGRTSESTENDNGTSVSSLDGGVEEVKVGDDEKVESKVEMREVLTWGVPSLKLVVNNKSVLQVNSPTPIEFETDYFKGKMLKMARAETFPKYDTCQDYFAVLIFELCRYN